MEVKKIVEGMTAPQVAQVIDDNFKGLNEEKANKVETDAKLSELGSKLPTIFDFDLKSGLLNFNGEVFHVNESNNYKYTEAYYPVKEGQVVTTNGYGTGETRVVCFYNEDKQYISGEMSGVTDMVDYIVPNGAAFVRFCTERNESYPLEGHRTGDNSDIQAVKSSIRYIVDSLKNGMTDMALSFDSSEGQYLDGNESGAVKGGGGQRKYTTQYYSVSKGDVIEAAFFANSNDSAILYDNKKRFIKKINCSAKSIDGAILIEIEQDGFIRFSNNYAQFDSPYAKKGLFVATITELKKSSDEFQRAKNAIPMNIDTSILAQGLLAIDGQIIYSEWTGITYPSYRYCPTYFEVEAGKTIVTNASSTGSAAGIIYYNEDKSIHSVVKQNTITPIEYVVPEGAVFVRFCTEKFEQVGKLVAYVKGDNPQIDELDEKIESVEKSTIKGYPLPFFGGNRTEWISDEKTNPFVPKMLPIEHKFKGTLTPQSRFIALGFDDFRETDFSFVIPLLNKYGAKAEFNQVRTASSDADTAKRFVNNVIYGGHELGDHTWMHYKFPFDEPLFNGQDPNSLEGNQQPFPTNAQMRNDVGGGKNAFGHNLASTVKGTLGYQAPEITTAWGNLSDAECQQLRDYFSVMKDTSTNLVVLLDELSNKYLGTTGSSRGSWDGSQYTGGIYTGCRTSENHEIWERILMVTDMYYKDVYGYNGKLITWSLPGSKSSLCYFPYNGVNYFDAEHTKRRGNVTKFTSSLFKNQDGSYKERSWTDCLREFGYKTTHDATPPTRSIFMSYQFIMNANDKRKDALEFPTNRSISYTTIANEYTKGIDLTGSKPLEVQMYESNGSFKTAIEKWREMSANGVIWGEVIDSEDTWSERMILEGLCKFCDKVGIKMISHAEAYDICFNNHITSGNLLYNPNLVNSAAIFVPTADNLPSNPDGYLGNCSVEITDGAPTLVVNGTTVYKHFGVPVGNLIFKAKVKGNGYISVRHIKNNTVIADVEKISPLTVKEFNNNEFTEIEIHVSVPFVKEGEYEDLYEGYGDKVIGLYFYFNGNFEVQNQSLKLQ